MMTLGPFRRRRAERLGILAEYPLFERCSRRDLEMLDSLSVIIRALPGEMLVREDELVGREVFIVVEGWAEVSRVGRRVAILGPGRVFGELTVLNESPCDATVVAKSPMELLTLGPSELRRVLDEVPCLAHGLLSMRATSLHAGALAP
ncbi:MAG: cyclic nucleotide-binding domain-containing protein [Actinomycetota bacterium]|nr:cyclic nucleotide-binding domain-containing protein [Actinomycetota bacterium]